MEGFLGLGTNWGRPGEGGGEAKMRWLNPKRDEVEERGPPSLVYDAALLRLIRGGETIILEWEVRLRSSVGGILTVGKGSAERSVYQLM